VTYLLVAFLVVTILPLLVAAWRSSLVGLGAQGLLMAAVLVERGWPRSVSGLVLLVDLLILRAYVVPRYLYGILRSQRVARRSDFIPANLLSWTLAAALVVVAFHFGDAVAPEGGDAALHVSVASAALLLGLLVLATQHRVFAQVVGALRIENAIALFELAGGHELPLAVQLGVTGALVLSLLTFGAFMRRLGGVSAAPADVAEGNAP
jgi:hydrogenase-4 component E